MTKRGEVEWLALLRTFDEPGQVGQSAGLEHPRDFDRAATQARFDLLAARLGDVFGCRLTAGKGPWQDASCFGDIRIPPESTLTRAEHSGMVSVRLSNFGKLATCLAGQDSIPPVHPEDLRRVEHVLDELGFLFVPAAVLEMTYEGPNSWVFGDRRPTSWFRRYFSYL